MQSLRPSLANLPGPLVSQSQCGPRAQLLRNPQSRTFTSTAPIASWLLPKMGDRGSTHKGRPRVPTGGSTKGTTVVWGDYGMRMVDHHRRLDALHLKNAEDTIKRKLRGMKYRLYTRIAANIPVYKKGNETRMGTGKGSMSHWTSRVAVSKIIFELKGEVHEQVVRDAFRVASNKMPGKYEFVKAGDVPVMGVTKLTPENIAKLMESKTTGIKTPHMPSL